MERDRMKTDNGGITPAIDNVKPAWEALSDPEYETSLRSRFPDADERILHSLIQVRKKILHRQNERSGTPAGAKIVEEM